MRGFRVAFTVVLLLVSLPSGRVWANGSTHEIAAGSAGPYQYAVGIWPPAPNPGTLHVAVLLFIEDKAVPEAGVTVAAARGSNRLAPVSARPRNDPYYHEADLAIPSPGAWTLSVAVRGPAGDADIRVPVEIAGQGSQVSPVARLVLLAAVGAFVTVLLWTAWHRRRKAPPGT